MLTHSIARILDRNKEFDIDAFRFKKRYRLFMVKKFGDVCKNLFSFSRLGKAQKTYPKNLK
jgi:hypothetical protein